MATRAVPRIYFCPMRMLLILLPFFLLTCDTTTELPVPEKKLVRVVADMQVAEAAMVGLSGFVRDSTAEVYYREIYALHQTDKDAVVASIDALKQQPKRLERFYAAVTKELERQGAHPGDPVD